ASCWRELVSANGVGKAATGRACGLSSRVFYSGGGFKLHWIQTAITLPTPAGDTGAMSRRRFITGLVALDIVACTLADLRPRGPRPCRATFELVRVGMTLEEIVAVVGGPPQPYNTIPVTYEWIGHPDPRWSYENWTVNDAGLIVYFDENGRAA